MQTERPAAANPQTKPTDLGLFKFAEIKAATARNSPVVVM